LRYLNLVPNPRWKPHSSLGYMMGHVSVLRGEGNAGYFLDDERVDVDGFARALERAVADHQPVCIAGTAFAFVALLDALETPARTFVAPAGSRIMETGGFKGRARVVERAELYARLESTLGVPQPSIVAEYGMTELLSQYYDAPDSRARERRIKVAPPWLHTLVVDASGHELPLGETGTLRHVDLANRSSVVAIDTEDRGYREGDGIVLLGRDPAAELRGCSLAAEEVAAN
jgi:non-ribosomal peptide synthetase component F